MTRYILLAAGGSLALLLGAFGFQALGYAPCAMCLWQRWPHAAAVVIGGLALALPWRGWPWVGALAAFATGAIGVYHTGVERGLWEGPSSCTGGALSGDLLSTSGTVVLCDQVSWAFMGLSMASWNALFSFALVGVWLMAAKGRP